MVHIFLWNVKAFDLPEDITLIYKKWVITQVRIFLILLDRVSIHYQCFCRFKCLFISSFTEYFINRPFLWLPVSVVKCNLNQLYSSNFWQSNNGYSWFCFALQYLYDNNYVCVCKWPAIQVQKDGATLKLYKLGISMEVLRLFIFTTTQRLLLHNFKMGWH